MRPATPPGPAYSSNSPAGSNRFCSSCSRWLQLPTVALEDLPRRRQLLLLLCRGCSAGAGKGDQRHLDTTKEQTGTWLSARKPEIRLMLVILSSLFARALGRSSRDPITTWLAAGAALRGLVREVVVFHEENELQDAALSAGSHLVLLNAVSAFWISKKAIPSARWAGLPVLPLLLCQLLPWPPCAPCLPCEGG